MVVINDVITEFVAKYIEEKTGIRYRTENFFQLKSRIEKVIHEEYIHTAEDIMHQAMNNPSGKVAQRILDIATNNETLFFRDRNLFDTLQSELLDGKWSESKSSIRVWSAACSTGQEPYSMAMLLEDWVTKKGGRSYEIYATDISDRVLKQAKEGLYSKLEIERGTTESEREKWFQFEPSTNTWRVKNSLKRCIHFSQQNLMQPTSIGQFDIILIRNVLIYFEPDKKENLLNRAAEKMNEDSYIILGASESIIGLNVNIQQTPVGSCIFYTHTN